MGRFKRQKVNCTLHGVDIYNIDPKQREELKKYLTRLNSELMQMIGNKAQEAIDNGSDLTDEELEKVKLDAMALQQADMSRMTRYWLTEYTSLENDDFDNKDLKDPSPELRQIISKVGKINIRPVVAEVQDSLEQVYSQTIKQVNKEFEEYKLGN